MNTPSPVPSPSELKYDLILATWLLFYAIRWILSVLLILIGIIPITLIMGVILIPVFFAIRMDLDKAIEDVNRFFAEPLMKFVKFVRGTPRLPASLK